MIMAFALFDFFSRNEIEVGRVSWVTSYFDHDKLINKSWDKEHVVEVGWPKNGTLTQLSPGSTKYPAKVISISDDKFQLLDLRKKEVEQDLPKSQEMGRGHRVKRKSKALNYSSDDMVETELAKPKKKKKMQQKKDQSNHLQMLMKEVLSNEIKKKQQPPVHDHTETLTELREEILKLKMERKKLEMENRNLRHSMAIMKDLPELLNEVKEMKHVLNACRPSKFDNKDEDAEAEEPEDSLQAITSKPKLQKLSSIVGRCNTHEASKLVNDLLTGLYSNDYLSKHSLTGQSLPKDEGETPKQRLDPAVVNEIIGIIMKHFPKKSPTEVKFYIRQKLNNAAKAMRKKKTIHFA